ncbi:hypothetical protein Cni_G06445 [Canna indica]|uniref:Ribosomal protein L34Ae n=1 Tax=Canna indica TaxID=4628 RepID=A0AAQ3JX21_9LILI|nr:hypothetical protein Cni_G06445 [Canna indica]
MHNCCLPRSFVQVIGHEAPSEPVHLISCHGQITPISREEDAVMFVLHVFTFLSFLLLVIHLLSFLLTKLFTFLHEEKIKDQLYSELIAEEAEEEDEVKPLTDDCHSENEELGTSIFSSWEEEGLFFFYSESAVVDPLLVEEEKAYSDVQQHVFKVDENFATESPSVGLRKCEDVPAITDFVKSSKFSEVVRDEDIGGAAFYSNEEAKREPKEEKEKEEFSRVEKLFTVDETVQFDSKKFKLEERTFGISNTTSESTSKSSMEWRSSIIFRDSETECPFSSSSRRSSSNWETYTLFRKYDEEMMFFDRISAQKLNETDSLRSLKFRPRSISQRIVHKFTAQKKNESNENPYQELESAYVAQICLAWEALNWNYSNFRHKNPKGSNSEPSCSASMAEQFQQFQVLLQRFIEDEPYERGRRPEVFARTRISSPKLLQVPEFQDSPEVDEGKEEMISSTEFVSILEDSIRTFMSFLKADRKNPCQVLKAMIKKKRSLVDPNLLHFLKRDNKKMKMKLKELLRPRSCLRRKRLKGEPEMEVLMGLIDMKIVSRILRMPEISQEQLHWCEEKMSKVRVCDGKIQRDSSPLFFPVH